MDPQDSISCLYIFSRKMSRGGGPDTAQTGQYIGLIYAMKKKKRDRKESIYFLDSVS